MLLPLLLVPTSLFAEVRLTEAVAPAARQTGVGEVPIETVERPSGQILSGLSIHDDPRAACQLGLRFRAPGAEAVTERRAAGCDSAPVKTLSFRKGQAITRISLCLDRDETSLQGVALTALPDYCVADPTLWSERESGAAFRLRVRQADGSFLRPPWSYARSCESDVLLVTVSDTLPGCKRWKGWSVCPEGTAIDGLDTFGRIGPDGGGSVTGITATCRTLATDF